MEILTPNLNQPASAGVIDLPLEPQPTVGRGRPPVSRREGDVEDLLERYVLIGQLIALGYKNTDIADALGVTPQTVSNARNNPAVRQHIRTLQRQQDATVATIKEELLREADESLDYLRKVRDGEEVVPANQRIAVCQDLLDRADVTPIRRNQTEALHGVFTVEDLKEIKGNYENARAESCRVMEQSGSEAEVDAGSNSGVC